MANHVPELFFVVNPGAGKLDTAWDKVIRDHFPGLAPDAIYELPKSCKPGELKSAIKKAGAPVVVAVGGDGTIKLVAEAIQGTDTALGIIPGGSANGMARELGIPVDPTAAMEILSSGKIKKIHLIRINDELCIHLSDIGFNAYVVKKFEDRDTRGMWGYVRAAWNVLWRHRKMQVRLKMDNEDVIREAVMVVIANATKYGNGVVINPKGDLYDNLFEVVVVKKVSFTEIFKMRFTNWKFNEAKTELFQTSSLSIVSRHHAHFQVDGETLSKVKTVNAEIIPAALSVVLPAPAADKK